MIMNKMGGNRNMTHAYIVDTTPDENGIFYKGTFQNTKVDNMASGEVTVNDVSDNADLSAKEKFIPKISFA